MSQDEEVSKSGAPIYRHKEPAQGWQAPVHERRNLEDIENHVAKYIGEVETVLHEIASDLIHLDVLYVPAVPGRPYHVLVTSGMSDLAMSIPDGMEEYDRAELLVVLPETWPISEQAMTDEASYWPIRWLKYVGRLPHNYNSWVGWGHTIPNSNPPEKIANTEFVGVMAMVPNWVEPEFFRLHSSSGDTISFYQLVPLYQEEMDLKLEFGAEELEVRFEQSNIGFVLDSGRKNVAKRKGWFIK